MPTIALRALAPMVDRLQNGGGLSPHDRSNPTAELAFLRETHPRLQVDLGWISGPTDAHGHPVGHIRVHGGRDHVIDGCQTDAFGRLVEQRKVLAVSIAVAEQKVDQNDAYEVTDVTRHVSPAQGAEKADNRRNRRAAVLLVLGNRGDPEGLAHVLLMDALGDFAIGLDVPVKALNVKTGS